MDYRQRVFVLLCRIVVDVLFSCTGWHMKDKENVKRIITYMIDNRLAKYQGIASRIVFCPRITEDYFVATGEGRQFKSARVDDFRSMILGADVSLIVALVIQDGI